MLRCDYSLCLLIALWVGTPARADEVDQLLRDIRAVSKQGAGSPVARAAWEKLVAEGRLSRPTGSLLDIQPVDVGDQLAGTRALNEEREERFD